VGAGGDFTVAATRDGNVWAWGDNTAGELGFGFTDNRSTPQTIPFLANVASIYSGGDTSFALKNDGSIWSWGLNASGQLGIGNNSPKSVPTQIPGFAGVLGIGANLFHTLAVKSDGTAWAWGWGNEGELGNGSNSNQQSPVQVAGLSNVSAVSAGGEHSLALLSNGTVWAWGSNYYGQLGNGLSTGSNTALQVPGLSNIVAISAGAFHSLALRSDGSVFAWGGNFFGQIGDGTTTNRATPVPVTGIRNVNAVSAGWYHSLVLRSDGTVWAWGSNYGNLGDGTASFKLTPVQVLGLTGIVQVSASKYDTRTSRFSVAMGRDGTVYSWGENDTGQLADGTYAQRLAPVIVLHENGSGSLQAGNWFLDLIPATQKNIAAKYIPAFGLLAAASGSDSSRTVLANLTYRPADVGSNGSVFITARVPAGSYLIPGNGAMALGIATQDSVLRERVGGPGALRAPLPRTRTSAPSGTAYVQIQLTPAGWQPVVNGQLVPFVTGVLGSALASQTILNNVDTTQLPGASFCIGYGGSASSMLSNGTVRSVVSVVGAPVGTVVDCVPSNSFAPQSGVWWNPAEGGRGYTLEYNGTNLFMATYLYDASGRSTWYGAGPAAMSGTTFSAPLTSYSGGQTLTGNFKPATQGASPGIISIVFTDATHATMTWPGGTIPITRYEFVTNGLTLPPTATQPQTGWWWNPSEGGRGFSVEVQNGSAFIASYMYDGTGNPVWYASGPAALTGTNTYQGSWTSYTGGQTLTGAYRSPTGTTNAGNLTLQFTSATTGTLTLPDNRQIPIQRFGF
jgi:alpha-tubulin suppressor-like RCC1 family protein